MKDPWRSFVLTHTFENAHQLSNESSPTELHYNYDWYISIKRTGDFFGAYLHRHTNEKDKPPTSVSFSILIKSTNGSQTISQEAENVFFGTNSCHGWPMFAAWKEVEAEFIKTYKLTVEVHVDVRKVFPIPDTPREFTLQRIIANVDELNEERSAVENHFEVPWSFVVKKQQDELQVDLHCEKQKNSNLWFIDTVFTFTIKAKDEEVFQEKRALTFNQKKKCHGLFKLVDWKDVLEKCVVDNKVDIGVHVKIFDIDGIDQKSVFGVHDEQYSDVTLVVGEKKFKANKGVLSRFSPVFRSMFNGKYMEAKAEEVPIKDVDADSFATFLSLIYVYKPEINSGNVKNLLILADRYDTPRVTSECMQFLIKTKDVDAKKKLQLAEQYNLVDLQENVLDSLKSLQEVKKLQERMGPMSEITAAALLDKAMSFVAPTEISNDSSDGSDNSLDEW